MHRELQAGCTPAVDTTSAMHSRLNNTSKLTLQAALRTSHVRYELHILQDWAAAWQIGCNRCLQQDMVSSFMCILSKIDRDPLNAYHMHPRHSWVHAGSHRLFNHAHLASVSISTSTLPSLPYACERSNQRLEMHAIGAF